MGTCEKCNQITEVGEYYYFYYGSQTGAKNTFDGMEVSYAIESSPIQVFLCSRCVIPRIIMRAINLISTIVLIAASILIGILAASGYSIVPVILTAAAIGILYIFIKQIILPLYFQYKKNYSKVKQIISNENNKEAGDKLAIKVKKRQFSMYKSNRISFFTREQASKLRKKQ